MGTQRPAELAEYEFNIRSFHPKETFGWSGLYFEGDDRRFSLKPNSHPKITSRIWHRVIVNTKPEAEPRTVTGSDASNHPLADEPYEYKGKAIKPKDRITSKFYKLAKGSNGKGIRIDGGYKGQNHLMPFSEDMKKTLGFTYVPTLNVNYKIRAYVDRDNRHLDLVTFIKGDGFPNCEAFVVGPDDTRVFLGIHVRKGVAPLSLRGNPNHPMIASAVRLPLNQDGSFSGTIADLLSSNLSKKGRGAFLSISDWNTQFASTSPNNGRYTGYEDLSYIRKQLGNYIDDLVDLDGYL
ncbi:hypothetical protein [Halospina sp. K52047b]|uniref:hypothetical protein n=1 Tax=Halospina sp. K52047b TaxID=2614160 RepID=UPI001787ED9C|nr:hypothetical protein [Halospina sp. K52047b]